MSRRPAATHLFEPRELTTLQLLKKYHQITAVLAKPRISQHERRQCESERTAIRDYKTINPAKFIITLTAEHYEYLRSRTTLKTAKDIAKKMRNAIDGDLFTLDNSPESIKLRTITLLETFRTQATQAETPAAIQSAAQTLQFELTVLTALNDNRPNPFVYLQMNPGGLPMLTLTNLEFELPKAFQANDATTSAANTKEAIKARVRNLDHDQLVEAYANAIKAADTTYLKRTQETPFHTAVRARFDLNDRLLCLLRDYNLETAQENHPTANELTNQLNRRLLRLKDVVGSEAVDAILKFQLSQRSGLMVFKLLENPLKRLEMDEVLIKTDAEMEKAITAELSEKPVGDIIQEYKEAQILLNATGAPLIAKAKAKHLCAWVEKMLSPQITQLAKNSVDGALDIKSLPTILMAAINQYRRDHEAQNDTTKGNAAKCRVNAELDFRIKALAVLFPELPPSKLVDYTLPSFEVVSLEAGGSEEQAEGENSVATSAAIQPDFITFKTRNHDSVTGFESRSKISEELWQFYTGFDLADDAALMVHSARGFVAGMMFTTIPYRVMTRTELEEKRANTTTVTYEEISVADWQTTYREKALALTQAAADNETLALRS